MIATRMAEYYQEYPAHRALITKEARNVRTFCELYSSRLTFTPKCVGPGVISTTQLQLVSPDTTRAFGNSTAFAEVHAQAPSGTNQEPLRSGTSETMGSPNDTAVALALEGYILQRGRFHQRRRNV